MPIPILSAISSSTIALAIPWLLFLYLHFHIARVNLKCGLFPDRLTALGTLSGVVLSGLFPQMHGQSTATSAIGSSLGGALAGFLTVWLFATLAKKLFGFKTWTFDTPAPFDLIVRPPEGLLVVGGAEYEWSEFFIRDSDRLEVRGQIAITEPAIENAAGVQAKFSVDHLWLGGRMYNLVELRQISGVASEVKLPREPIGFGIVKFFLFTGSFLGPSGVLIYLAIMVILVLASSAWTLLQRRLFLSGSDSRMNVGPHAAATAVICVTYKAWAYFA